MFTPNAQRIAFVHNLRGLAALFVLISHLYARIWIRTAPTFQLWANAPVPDPWSVPSWLQVICAIKPFLHFSLYGTGLFFLISGFVIPFSLKEKSFGGFVIDRFFRIYPPYVIGLSLGLLAVMAHSLYFSRSWPYPWLQVASHYLPGIRNILGFSTIDTVSWTLEIQVRFYLICALFIGWFRSHSLKIFFIPLALGVGNLLLSPMEGSEIWKQSLRVFLADRQIVFLFIGVVFYYMRCSRLDWQRGTLLMCALFLLFSLMQPLACHPVHTPDNIRMPFYYGCAFFTFLLAATFPRYFNTKILNFMGDISYSLYILHTLIGTVILSLLMHAAIGPSLALLITTIIVFSIAWIFHKGVEVPSRMVGRYLAHRI